MALDSRPSHQPLIFPSSARITDAPAGIQIATQYARLLHPYPAAPKQLPRSGDICNIKRFTEELGPMCIGCWLKARRNVQEHRLEDCTHSPNPYKSKLEWEQWRALVNFQEGTCYGCAFPQHVRLFASFPSFDSELLVNSCSILPRKGLFFAYMITVTGIFDTVNTRTFCCPWHGSFKTIPS